MTDVRVVVIGGGFAGVAAAAWLRARGVRVTLIEARPTLGGRARSDVLDDLPIDTGAQLITGGFTRTVRMLGAQLESGVAHDIVVRGDERLPLRFGSLRSLLSFSGLSALDKVRLATYLLPLLARYHDALDASGTRIPASLDTESVRAFVQRKIGPAAADTLAEPPCNGFYNLSAADVSLAFYLTLGRYGSDGEALAPVNGWSAALGSALGDVEVVRDTRATALEIERDTARRTTRVCVRDASGRAWEGNAAVIATDPRAAHALLAAHLSPDDSLARWLSAIPMRDTLTLALALDCAPPRDAFGIFQDVRTARTVSACVVHGAKHALRVDRDAVLAWTTPASLETLRAASSESIAAKMLPDVEALVPDVRGHIRRARVYRFEPGSPIPYIGFVSDRANGTALADAMALPVALAGDYLTTPLIEGAVASGEHAAARIARILGLT